MSRIIVVALLLGLPGAPIQAQESNTPQAQLREEGTYYKLFTLEFKPGKTDDALDELDTSLVPAWRAAGIRVQVLEQLLQTRDVLLLIELKDGPSALSYSVPEQDARAWAALVQIAGSADAANGAVDRFIGYVQRQSETLVFERR